MTTAHDIAPHIDHTLLAPTASQEQIKKLCSEAATYSFKSVCVPPSHVSLAKECLEKTSVLVCTVIGFPLGANTSAVKAYETEQAVSLGAQEIDMVINIGALKEGRHTLVQQDIAAVVAAANGCIVKVIIETALLKEEEIIQACELCTKAGAHFVKTSTGFSHAGATEEHVSLMKKHLPAHMSVKASGGIKTLEKAQALLQAGASRLGMSSGVAILEQTTPSSHHDTNY